MVDKDTFDDDIIKFIKAEQAAFETAGKKTGTVEFICPICGGKAIGRRYKHAGYDGRSRIGALGSGCPQCGMSHT